MRWCNSFGRSLLFALLAALAYPVYRAVIGTAVGVPLAFASYAALAAAAYLFGIARHPARGLAAAFATLACCFGLVVLGATAREVALAAAALMGVLRSGLLYGGGAAGTQAFGRRFGVEVGLLGTGLALACLLSPASAAPGAFAFWGFFLAQSGFFLVGGSAARTRQSADRPPAPDAFEEPCRRARALLDRHAHGLSR
jgi:hypothetical protein